MHWPALADDDHLSEVQAAVTVARGRIDEIAATNGLVALPSAANFVAIDCGADGAFAARVLAELVARDIFVRKPFVAPQDRCIRVSAGTPEMLDVFERALPEAPRCGTGRLKRRSPRFHIICIFQQYSGPSAEMVFHYSDIRP